MNANNLKRNTTNVQTHALPNESNLAQMAFGLDEEKIYINRPLAHLRAYRKQMFLSKKHLFPISVYVAGKKKRAPTRRNIYFFEKNICLQSAFRWARERLQPKNAARVWIERSANTAQTSLVGRLFRSWSLKHDSPYAPRIMAEDVFLFVIMRSGGHGKPCPAKRRKKRFVKSSRASNTTREGQKNGNCAACEGDVWPCTRQTCKKRLKLTAPTMKHFVLRLALFGAALSAPLALAMPRSGSAKRLASKRAALRRKMARAPRQGAGRALDQSALPRYVSLATIARLQRQYASEPLPALQPFWKGQPLKRPMVNLLTGPTLDLPPAPLRSSVRANALKNKRSQLGNKRARLRFAQGFPRPIPPAAVPSGRYSATNRRGARPIIPQWVRYPLEFQLCGIGLGTKAVDKDRFNRIDRYGLFALHGNPTAVVLPIIGATGGTGAGAGGAAGGQGAGGGGGGAPTGGAGDAQNGGAAGAATAVVTTTNLTLQQTPPGVATLFPSNQLGGLPDWALAITVELKPGEVEWLYKRDTFAMGFVVDKFGYCEAIIAAGITSPIARTQQEDPIHTVKLGDDFRKVLFRYGYPDDLQPLGPDVASANSVTGTPGGAAGGGAAGGAPGGAGGAGGGATGIGGGGARGGGGQTGAPTGAGTAGAGGGAATATPDTNGAYRTYDLRYDQTYNTVFTIRNNRVVRMYIFGDPDFFTDARRNSLRTRY